MILIVGGVASGKRSFAQSLGYGDSDIADGVMDDRPVVHHAEKLLGKAGGAREAAPDVMSEAWASERDAAASGVMPGVTDVELLAHALAVKEIVTISEVGAGVVPTSVDERVWREDVGGLASALAARATCVVRMTCGVPCAIKGDLPGVSSASVPGPASACASSSASAEQHEYPFFTNRACAYFPCHDDIDPNEFNCLFCYCPLYALGPECGGRFTYTEAGVKNCSSCSIPHKGDAGTKLVQAKWAELSRLARR